MIVLEPNEDVLSQVGQILRETPVPFPEDVLHAYVERFIARRASFLALVEQHGSPLYVFDERVLRERARTFRAAFEPVLPDVSCYYAVKSNNHPLVAATVVDERYGLDVSSGVELHTALSVGANDIVFSGPGKTDTELLLAIGNADRVTVLIDSFGELERLAELARVKETPIRSGVRITPPAGQWRKFGVPIHRLRRFWEQAARCDFVRLCGLQFHTSWNLSPVRQIDTICAIGRELQLWPESLREQIEFLDIGGGFWPPQGEWMLEVATPRGKLLSVLERCDGSKPGRSLASAQPISEFAEQLAKCLEENIFCSGTCRIHLEPGRWICNDAMHLLLTVIDKKESDLAILDAGTNAIGWERFESDYAPLINLSHPAMKEVACDMLGSLCTPHDVWGYAYWGDDLVAGDVLLLPDQGAYTYSLRQHFIKSIPPVVPLRSKVENEPPEE